MYWVMQGTAQKRQQLPVTPSPTVYARGSNIGMKWRILNHGDISHRRTTRQRTFEQVMAQHLALWQATRKHLLHGLYIQQSFTRKSPLAKHVLIYLRACSAVGIDATLTSKQPVVQRQLFG